MELVGALDAVDCSTGTAEAVTASDSALQRVAGILPGCDDGQTLRNAVALSVEVYIHHLLHGFVLS